jgi:hypothetical protein
MGNRRQGPLVYLSPAVARKAERLAPGQVIETTISEAIMRNRASRHQGELPRGQWCVHCDDFVAIVKRKPSFIRPRGSRVWLVTDIKERTNENGNC